MLICARKCTLGTALVHCTASGAIQASHPASGALEKKLKALETHLELVAY